jgi:hypothetical protein
MTVVGAMGGKSEAPADGHVLQPRPGPVWGVFHKAQAGDGRIKGTDYFVFVNYPTCINLLFIVFRH